MSLTTFLNAALISGILIAIFVGIFGAGGAFEATWNLGKFVANVPTWVWFAVAGAYLLKILTE